MRDPGRMAAAEPAVHHRREAEALPALVTLHVWRVPFRNVPAALGRMLRDRRVRRHPGVRFAKLLGTGDGRTFRLRDTTLHRWALLTAWHSADDAADFEHGDIAGAWAQIADERLRLDLEPLAVRGRWSGVEPFGRPRPRPWGGPVAALTRARIRPRRAYAFHRAVPTVAGTLREAAGLRLAMGIGDAPIGLLGTFSLWDCAQHLREFAYGDTAHADVVRRSPAAGWFAEEMFARFAVHQVHGTFDGRAP